MTRMIVPPRTALLSATLATVLCGFAGIAFATPLPAPAAEAQGTNPAAAAAAAKLNKKQYSSVTVAVDNGIATLSGTVDLYAYKADAEKRVSKARGVTAVRDLIEVAGPTVSDQVLETKLTRKLAYDRVGYGNAFNAITVSVNNGVVTLGGHARTDVDKDSALALVSTYPGVKDVTGDIKVDPVSFMDDQTRIRIARAIYSDSFLSQYSSDPARPIRISVQNGHVELYGTVNTQTDKQVAFMRANAVPGVFSVKNYLEVAGQSGEGQ